ncbi:MAG TPA: hypothetical protein VGW77_25705 [Candidatus Binatia bacterium]|nr:hypothetical protein [Candidatus Binatia bacterium]
MTAALVLVSWSIYRSWSAGPWDLPGPSRIGPAAATAEKQAATTPRVPINTDMIVSKNLFDPERGAGATREAEENSRAFQRVRNMILIGTIIIGNNRTAILQDSPNPSIGPAPAGQLAAPMRLKLGDNVEGFRLAEIADKKVVFARDTARVEVLLDYFRKVEVAQPRAVPPGQPSTPGAVAPIPRVVPNLPRRARIPTPGNPAPDS